MHDAGTSVAGIGGDGTGGSHIQDVTLDARTFAALDTGVSRVFITENEINFLAFPRTKDAMAIFGAGYGFESLGQAHWLARCRLFYWGDIDTHGFAILDELRGHFDQVESFLMDRDTFLAFESLWGDGELADRPGSVETDRRGTRPVRRPPGQPHRHAPPPGAGTHRVRVGNEQAEPAVAHVCRRSRSIQRLVDLRAKLAIDRLAVGQADVIGEHLPERREGGLAVHARLVRP